MANQLYNLKLSEAVNDLNELAVLENLPKDENEQKLGLTYERKEEQWFQFYANLYVRYIDCYKKLEDVYDQSLHPQKKSVVKEMLENTMIRMCQIKQDLVSFNFHGGSIRSDFIHLDELLIDLKLNEDALEIPVPRYFKTDNQKAIEERNQLHDKLLIQFKGHCIPEEEEIDDQYVLDIDIEKAIWLIQKNERGRQGIQRAIEAKNARKLELKKFEKQKKIAEGIDVKDDTEREDAILVIQKHFRGFVSREIVDKMREDELLFLGMKRNKEDPKDPNSTAYKYEKTRERRKCLQAEYEKDYKGALEELTEEIRTVEGPDLKDKMIKERREWVLNWFELNEGNDLPPKVDEFYKRSEVAPPLTEEEQEKKRIEEENAAKEAKKKKDAKKAGKGKKSKKESPEDEFLANRAPKGPSEIVQEYQKNVEKYANEWENNEDERKNFFQKHNLEMARSVVKPVVEEEIKVLVDDFIKIELDNLRTKFGIKKPKAKKAKKKKKKKTKEMPGGKLVGNRDPRDLLAELTEAGIAKKLLPANVSDMLGDFSKLGAQFEREQEKMPDPSMASLRQLVTEYIAIPLGSLPARQKLPLIRTCLFFGPSGAGKTLLVRALQSQCSALILDLTPSLLNEKYTEKTAIRKLFYMVWKVANTYEPAIILFDEADLVFPGKKKSPEAKKATKMKKSFMELKKFTKDKTRVVIIGCMNKYEVSPKDIRTYFEKKIYFPFPDYATRQLLFKTFVERKGGILKDAFSLSTLSHITKGYTAGSFLQAIDKVLTERRKAQMPQRPLALAEFVGPVSNTSCVWEQDLTRWRDLNDDVTGIKERREKLNAPPEDEDAKKKKKGKKK